MKQKPRIYYSASQKALMRDRWQKGDSLAQIAQLFDRYHSSIERILAEAGGILPAPRYRSRLALTFAEREEISRAVAAGHSFPDDDSFQVSHETIFAVSSSRPAVPYKRY